MIRNLWGLTILCAGLAFMELGLAFLENSSPKQTARALFALALAIIPYILTRAMNEFNQTEPAIQTTDLSVEDDIEQWLVEQDSDSSN